MTIYKGSTEIKSIFKGTNEITSIYKGNSLIENFNEIPVDRNQAQYFSTFFSTGNTLDINRPLEIYLHMADEVLNLENRFYFNGSRWDGVSTNAYRVTFGLGTGGVFFERNSVTQSLSTRIGGQHQPCYLKANYNPSTLHWTFELFDEAGISKGTYTEAVGVRPSDTQASNLSTDYQLNVGSVEIIHIKYRD